MCGSKSEGEVCYVVCGVVCGVVWHEEVLQFTVPLTSARAHPVFDLQLP